MDCYFQHDKVPAIALVCAETTSSVDPDSRCSRVSPTQAITLSPWERAYATLSPINCIHKYVATEFETKMIDVVNKYAHIICQFFIHVLVSFIPHSTRSKEVFFQNGQ